MALKLIFFVLFAISLINGQSCPHSDATLELYSSTAAWNTANAAVVIPAGRRVKITATTLTLASLEVSGTLVFDNANINLNVGWIKINNNGAIIMGSPTCRITSKIIITLTGARSLSNNIGIDSDGVSFGTKGFVVANGATVDLNGFVATKSWTRLNAIAQANTTTITVEDAVNWSVGDDIVIASTDFGPVIASNTPNTSSISWGRGTAQPDQNEQRKIRAISGKTITLDTPLKYLHWGKDYEKAEVGILTRRIVIQGDNSSLTSEFGGHFMMRKGKMLRVSGVEFTKMGQRGVLGRYPVHFHIIKEAFTANYTVSDCSIHNNFQRCLVVHDSSGMRVLNNVAFNTNGHCYFLEEGGERLNVFDGNLGIAPKPVPNEHPLQIIPSDKDPSVFWITNPNNTWVNNVAVGGRFGYWFSLPISPIGASYNDYVTNPAIRPRYTDVGYFKKNVAHSITGIGLHFDDMLELDGTTLTGNYDARKGPFVNSPTSYTKIYPLFSDLVIYKCRNLGIWGHTSIFFSNVVLLDNRRGIMSNGLSMLANSIVIGETDNIGTPLPGRNRSSPDLGSNANVQITGHESYDNGGPQWSINNTFINFVSTPSRPAGALGNLLGGPFMIQTKNVIVNCTFINANKWNGYATTADNHYGVAMFDVDGSVTGNPWGGWMISNISHMAVPSCEAKADWNGYSCMPFRDSFGQLTVVDNLALANPVKHPNYTVASGKRTLRGNFTNILTGETGSSNGGMVTWQCPSGTPNCFRMVQTIAVKQPWLVNFVSGPFQRNTPKDISFQFQTSNPGDWITVAIPYPPSAQPFNVQLRTSAGDTKPVTMTQAPCLNQLNSSTYFYDTRTQHLWLEFINTRNTPTNIGNEAPSWYQWSGNDVRVIANCVDDCAPTKFDIPAVVPIDAEETYKAELFDQNGNQAGVAWATVDPYDSTVDYSVYHKYGLFGVSSAYLTNGKGGARINKSFPNIQNPFRGILNMGIANWQILANNSLHINLALVGSNQVVSGKFVCQGTCSKPPVRSVVPNCATINPNTTIFADNITAPWTFMGTSAAANLYGYATEESVCGTNSLRLNLTNGNIGFMRTGAQWWNLTTSPFKTLEFYVKVGAGYGERTLYVLISNGTTVNNLKVVPKYIDNLIVDDSGWTRIRVPIIDLTLGQANLPLKYLYIHQEYSASNCIIYVDNIRFTTEEVPELPVVPCNVVSQNSNSFVSVATSDLLGVEEEDISVASKLFALFGLLGLFMI